MSKIKYGLIGFGGIAENRIAKEGFACDRSRFAPLENATLVAATDLNQARKPAAEALGLEWYDNAQKMIDDSRIDAVYIATNNLTHAPLATMALNAGKHVIVEKPLATTPEDAQSLVALAKAKNLSIAVDHMMIYNRLNRQAKELINQGAVGTVNDSCFHMDFAYGFDPAEAATWRCNNDAELGGPIGDVASHCFYMAEFMLDDEIDEVAAVYYPKTVPIAVETGAYIRFRMKKSGLSGSVHVSFGELRGGLGGTLSNLGYEIYGDKGVLRGYGTMFQLSGYDDEPLPIRLELDQFTSQQNFKADGPSPNIYQSLIQHHAESIIKGEPIFAADGPRNVRLCFAAHESARQGGLWRR
ncbi:MAG: Gfo/Idh/MocA family oxidoreductase [Planctomycetia bacterium]|nr:Gfo/Idh/MocA family oxidoreductase [Planctomycetia bacterium]